MIFDREDFVINLQTTSEVILGLPGDDFKGFLGSVQNVMTIEPNKFQTFPLSILPGSDYDRRRKELGIKTMKGSKSMDIDSIIETKSFPRDEIKKALERDNFMTPTEAKDFGLIDEVVEKRL